MTREQFADHLPTEGRLLDRISAYLDLLARWQRRINLVGSSTLADPWRRHILDSAQLLAHLPSPTGDILDLGSGAGLPGLVVAIVGDLPVTLVDSDARKCAFLREAARITAAPVTVLNQRIETLPVASASVVTARALAPLARLLPPIAAILRPFGTALLLKGRAVHEELTLADKHWKMAATASPSLSDPDGWVLKLQEIEPRHVS